MDERGLKDVCRISDWEFTYQNAHCFKVPVLDWLGPAQAVFYDVLALKKCCEIIRRDHIHKPIVYVMACRVGPFIGFFAREIHKMGGKLYLNPDGHEWKRGKWNAFIRKYWKISERLMVKYSDLVICDSRNIEKYIHKCYDGRGAGGTNPNTTFIAYGAETQPGQSPDEGRFEKWLGEMGLKRNEYYLTVGRLVPENNYEIMIREFMKSHTGKKFVIISTENGKFLNQLEQKLRFYRDDRIRFLGTVYDPELLRKIRKNAYGNFHGHEVGGTNPSLLEALADTKLNLVLDVSFNREVAEDTAIYWDKSPGCLAALIDQADCFDQDSIETLGMKAKERIRKAYSWEYISSRYAEVFLDQQR